MDYVIKMKVQFPSDDEAKDVMNDLLDEADALGSTDDAMGELFYSDGETRVP